MSSSLFVVKIGATSSFTNCCLIGGKKLSLRGGNTYSLTSKDSRFSDLRFLGAYGGTGLSGITFSSLPWDSKVGSILTSFSWFAIDSALWDGYRSYSSWGFFCCLRNPTDPIAFVSLASWKFSRGDGLFSTIYIRFAAKFSTLGEAEFPN